MFKRPQVCAGILLAWGSGTAMWAGNAVAQDQAQQLERVEITGSSIKRIDAEQALPVTVIKREEIDRLGVTSTEQLLSKVTATSFVGAITTAESAGIQTNGLAGVSLRGLGSQRTLVLVNGRRLANFASDGTTVDVNSIPLSSVDRVEVLRDGASSVYGSDAVGGVINFILRSNFQGIEVSGYAGSPSRSGGGQQYKAGLVGGWGNLASDRFNVLLSFDYDKEKALFGSQRNFSNFSWTEDGLYSQSATPSGRLFGPWVMGVPGDQQPTLDSVGHPLSPSNCAQNGSGFDPAFGTCRYNSAPLVDILPDIERYNFAGSAHFQLNPTNTLFAEGFYTKSKIITLQQPSPISAAFLLTDKAFAGSGVEQSLLLFPGNPNYPLAYLTSQNLDTTKPYSVTLRTFDNGRRLQTNDNDQVHLAAGVDGSQGDWDYNVAASHNSSKVTNATVDGYMSQLALVSLLNNTPNWDPFSQYQTPAIAAAMRATNFAGDMLSATYSTDGVDGRLSRSFGRLPGGPISAAVGVSFRRENYDYQPTAAYMSGDISGYGGQQLPVNVSRNTTGVFGELELPLLKQLTGNVSLRTDKYPNKTTTNPKLGLRFQPSSMFLIRSSVGTGFRAPSLPELDNPQVVGTSATFRDPVKGTTNQYTLVTGGNPDLKPEKSRQASLGIVFEPTRTVSIGIDYFQIKLSETIQNGGLAPAFIVQQAATGNPNYTPFVQRDGAGNITQISAVNINAGSTDIKGFDLSVRAELAKVPWGTVTADLSGTYMAQYDVTLPDGTKQGSIGATTDANGNLLAIQGGGAGSNGGGIIFRWRHNLTVGISNDSWGASVTQNFQSGYGDNINFNGDLPVRQVGSYATYDAQASYTAIKNLRLTLGIKNLFDKNPPFAYTNGNYFQVGWDPTYYDPRARFIYVTGNYKF